MNVLEIDLTCSTSNFREIEAKVIDEYTGGRGVAGYLLFRASMPGIDPLDPSSPLVIATGPLTGTPFPMGGRFIAAAKSPLTNTAFTSSCGGRLGVHLKKSGIDNLFVSGKASIPTYISIHGGTVQLHPADEIWGREKSFCKSWLRDKHGKDVSILLIGKAGEKQVLFASAENDGWNLERGGFGAILGSKNVKAIVVPGERGERIRPADQEAFSFVAYECKKWLSANPVTSQALPQFGTSGFLTIMQESGVLSVKNHREPGPDEVLALSGEALRRLVKRRKACPFCPVACGRVVSIGSGPELDGLWSLGANLCLFDIEVATKLNNLCNQLGMDAVSTGAVIALACELTERNISDLGVTFGDPVAVERLLVEIGEGSSRGILLGQGTKKVAEHFGVGESGAHVKGLDLPACDPRGAYGNGLGYATSNEGDAMVGPELLGIPKLLDRFAVQGKASLLALNQNTFAFMDSLVLCRFAAFAIPADYFARIAGAVTGKKISWEESIRIGERIWNAERVFNLREGVEPDGLPARLATFPIGDMLQEYYAVRGWGNGGVPSAQKLKQLNLF
jgi:aldehyde:ferredoxin oxidoreductase